MSEKETTSHPHEHSKAYLALVEELKTIELTEMKLERVIQFMSNAIAQVGAPHFKEFWEAKKLVLELFKEHINPSIRVLLWTHYSEICREAHSLKELLDEQSSFAGEQIEMAIAALAEEVEKTDERLPTLPEPDFSVISQTIDQHKEQYLQLQKELNLLNTFAARISALKKELMRTELRLRIKNKLFDRLSALGDVLFPRRKSKIKQVSELFSQDVDAFIQNTFVGEMRTAALFDVREEIKALQGVAKVLTLNTETFTKTRKQLSECWDSVREVVTERKKVSHDLRIQHRQSRDEIAAHMEAVQAEITAKSLSEEDAHRKLDDIAHQIRAVSLSRPDVFALKDQLQVLRNSLFARADDAKNQRMVEEQEREIKRAHMIEEVESRLKNLIVQIEKNELVGANEAIGEIEAGFKTLNCTKHEKFECEKQIRRVRDALARAREVEMLNGAPDAKREVLREKRKRRSEIKAQVDSLRKMRAGAQLDFTQAMELEEMFTQEKERLDDLDQEITDIENLP